MADEVVARPARSPWLTRILLLAASVVVTFVVARVIGKIDWASVWDSLTHLTWWQPPVLLLVVVVRQRPRGWPAR